MENYIFILLYYALSRDERSMMISAFKKIKYFY